MFLCFIDTINEDELRLLLDAMKQFRQKQYKLAKEHGPTLPTSSECNDE